ncbi:MAG TPA: glutamate mutase L [Nocardioides sp.]
MICVDFGSTFTKALLVDLEDGAVVGSAAHPTTLTTDVLDGFDDCREQLGVVDDRARTAQVLACSSAGGGLRIAVVGNEELVTAEAGRRVGLSSGGKAVAVIAVAQTPEFAEVLLESQPDVVLLTGGTDGGNPEPICSAAQVIADSAWGGPVVVAGNVEAQDRVARILAGQPHVLADNVVPQIGVLDPASARSAVREMFLAHVIGGKGLSRRADFPAMVRGATPDVVLRGVEVLAALVGDVAVVDIGGATTDVHSVIEVDPDTGRTDDGLARDVVAPTPVTRTVEGDLGMRWSAVSTVEEGVAGGVLGDVAGLEDAARRRLADPGLLPHDELEREYDVLLAATATSIALRRHAGRSRVVLGPDGRVLERTGTDLREVDLLVGSGGVLRAADAATAQRILAADADGGWQFPESPQVVVDRDYVLAAIGLLVTDHPRAAQGLARSLSHPKA